MLILLQEMISFDVEHGALTQLWAGTSPEGKDLNGKVSPVWFQDMDCILTLLFSTSFHSRRSGHPQSTHKISGSARSCGHG